MIKYEGNKRSLVVFLSLVARKMIVLPRNWGNRKKHVYINHLVKGLFISKQNKTKNSLGWIIHSHH